MSDKIKPLTEFKHPIQPVGTDEHGTWRFKENEIVSYVLEWASKNGCDLNHLACRDFSKDDREQFAQLIGYSLSGASSLSYISDELINSAYRMAEEGETEEQAKIRVLEDTLGNTRKAVKEAATELFRIHPEDLRA